MPPSAYGKLVTPLILSSADNKSMKPTMHPDPKGGWNFYSDKYVAATPWKQECVDNDGCAQYGVGEMCEGPEGHRFCVAEAWFKSSGGKITKPTLMSSDVVIGVGAVCSEHGQCCTNNCVEMAGQYSKMCMCPKGSRWSEEQNQCVGAMQPGLEMCDIVEDPATKKKVKVCNQWNDYERWWDPAAEAYTPLPKGVPQQAGTLCRSHLDCGIGYGCNPDGFCASQIIPDKERDGNRINHGGNCETTDQCANNIECLPAPPVAEGKQAGKICQCPRGQIFDFNSRTCQCPDGTMVYQHGKCIPPDQATRKLCPSAETAVCATNSDCGLGEYCNISTNQILCAADLHTGMILQKGNCTDSSQCKTGKCMNVGGAMVCVEPEISAFKYAVQQYL
jgi:hypothetical protein